MNAPRQAQLLGSALHLDWLPDETLYSLASRHHRLSGNLRPDQTAQQMFGHSKGGSPHDLPAGLDYFAAALGTRLGTGESVALNRTVLPGLLAFRAEPDRRDAVKAMCSPRIGGLKSRLGLPASGFGATCLLKACVACMRVDAADHGTAYWRRTHQLPGVVLCLEHQEILRVSATDRAKQFRFGWGLPTLPDLVEVTDRRSTPSNSQRQLMLRLTQMATDAAATVTGPAKDGARLATALWAGMATRGWIAQSGRLDRKVATEEWRSLLIQLSILPEWRDLNISESSTYSQIISLLSDPTRGHVLRPLTLVACLFDSWNDYLDSIESHAPRADVEEQARPYGDTESVRSKLIARTGTEVSLSAAAKEAGVAVATAQAWLAAAGLSSPKRPSKLRDDTLCTVVENLRQGFAPNQIAALVGLSDASVQRVLRTTVGLRAQWLDAKRDTSLEEARKKWSQALGGSVMIGAATARVLEPKTYAWLYRNDRAWLLEINEAAKRLPAGNHASTNWDARDHALSDACQHAALALHEQSDGGCIKLIDLIRAVPELRTKLHRLQNLPLTASVIRRVCRGPAVPKGSTSGLTLTVHSSDAAVATVLSASVEPP